MNNTYYVEEKMDKDEKVKFLGELRKRNEGNCKIARTGAMPITIMIKAILKDPLMKVENKEELKEIEEQIDQEKKYKRYIWKQKEWFKTV